MPTLVSRKNARAELISSALVRRLGDAMLLALESPNVELSVLLTNDATIRELNHRHREKDKPTDVLSFPLAELPKRALDPQGILGDVVISLETAERQARGRRRDLASEV